MPRKAWREQGLVRDLVVVEAPVKTHALVAYWSDFVRWGLVPPPQTPCRAPAGGARAVDPGWRASPRGVPAFEALGAHTR